MRNRDLTAMRDRNTLLRAEQSRAEQSRAEANCALFAPCSSGALEIEYYIRDG